MLEKKALIGSTIKLTYNFYSRVDDVTPADVDYPTIKIYDYNRVQIGTDIVLGAPNKISTGSYFYQLVVPNNPPYIDVECLAQNGGYPDVSRDRLELYWSENDISDATSLTLTVGTNTYVSLADANSYFATSLNSSTWDGASDTDKAKALVTATRMIDRLVFKGSKVNTEQALQFPRYYKSHQDPDILNLVYTASDEIPEAVEFATCEEAISLLQGQATPNMRATLQQQGVKRIKFGNAEEEYVTQSGINNLSSSDAKTILRPYLATTVNISRERC